MTAARKPAAVVAKMVVRQQRRGLDGRYMPELTPEIIRERLRKSAKGADELREKLERSHLAGISRFRLR